MSGAMLVLFGGETPDDPIAWVRVRRSDGAEMSRGVFNAGAEGPQGQDADAVLVLRGVEAQLRSVELPAKTDAQARGAAAFAFEGELAIDPALAFYAVGPASGAGGRRLVAALDRKRLQAWVQRCRAAGCAPRAIYLDCALLPVSAGQVRVCELDGQTIVSGGAAGGFSIETALAPMLIKAWLARVAGAVQEVDVQGEALEAVAAALSGAGVTVSRSEATDVRLALARAAAAPSTLALNVQQGDLAPASGKGRGGHVWLTACVLAVTAVLLQAALQLSEGWRDHEAAKTALASAETAFRQMRPDVKRIVNLRAQVTAALNAAQKPTSNPVIATSYPVVTLLQAHPDVRLEEVRHEAPGRRVSMRFSGAQPAILDAAIADLRASYQDVEVGQMQAEQGRISVTVTMVAS